MNHNDTPVTTRRPDSEIRVLFLHGSGSDSSSRKAGVLKAVFDTQAPTLPFPDGSLASFAAWMFDRPSRQEARRRAQSVVDSFRPHVICGSSIGGALAATLESDAALVLVAPAFGFPTLYRSPPALPARTIILHARDDSLVRQAQSRRLLRAHPGRTAAERADIESICSDLLVLGYDQSCPRLISIGLDHRCNEPHHNDVWNTNPKPHDALVAAVRLLAGIDAARPC